MITIIDYGVGNISAFSNVYKFLNIPVKIARRVEDLIGTTKIILPGVGHFDYAMRKFEDSGMKTEVNRLVLNENKPVIGICVGMQMMANKSEEGELPGLGWIDGEVLKFNNHQNKKEFPLPHMGWNDVKPSTSNKLFAGLEDKPRFYFLHSYYFKCNHIENTIAETDYSIRFSCGVNRDNIYGIQFHPEKSHRFGIQLLKNFAELC